MRLPRDVTQCPLPLDLLSSKHSLIPNTTYTVPVLLVLILYNMYNIVNVYLQMIITGRPGDAWALVRSHAAVPRATSYWDSSKVF